MAKRTADREHLWQALGRCYFWQNPGSIFQVPAKTGLEDQGQGLALHRRCARRAALYPRSALAVESEPHAPSVWGVTCGPGRLSRHQHVSCLLWVQQACCADGIYCGTCPAPGCAQATPVGRPSRSSKGRGGSKRLQARALPGGQASSFRLGAVTAGDPVPRPAPTGHWTRGLLCSAFRAARGLGS